MTKAEKIIKKNTSSKVMKRVELYAAMDEYADERILEWEEWRRKNKWEEFYSSSNAIGFQNSKSFEIKYLKELIEQFKNSDNA